MYQIDPHDQDLGPEIMIHQARHSLVIISIYDGVRTNAKFVFDPSIHEVRPPNVSLN